MGIKAEAKRAFQEKFELTVDPDMQLVVFLGRMVRAWLITTHLAAHTHRARALLPSLLSLVFLLHKCVLVVHGHCETLTPFLSLRDCWICSPRQFLSSCAPCVAADTPEGM